jgi:hypothetical protein
MTPENIGRFLGFILGSIVVLGVAACIPLAIIWALNTLGANIAYSGWSVLAVIVIMLATRLIIKFDDVETIND